HADSKATFSQDYKTIARKLGVDKALKDEDLFAAIRENIELQPQWVLILDNADDLALFGIGRAEETTTLFEYIPRAPTGTILWTSRDEHIIGTLRWELLQETEVDRHRKPNVSNSVLETWAISIDRIRRESEMAYRILHVMAYMDNRNIAFEMVAAASKYMYKGADKGPEEREVRRAVMRLKEFSFISEEKTELPRGDCLSFLHDSHNTWKATYDESLASIHCR
ncbi:hypothetical protein B0J13DRAFT_461501, partial [Dactylonectria estremocensis]